jgi:hypothetical protein
MNWTAAARRADAAGLVVAVALLCLAALVWWDMASLSLSSTYGLGPRPCLWWLRSGSWRSP